MTDTNKIQSQVVSEELEKIAHERSDYLQQLAHFKGKITETAHKCQQECTNYETQMQRAIQELTDLNTTCIAETEKQNSKNAADIAAMKKELQELDGKLVDLKKAKVDNVLLLKDEAEKGLIDMQQRIESQQNAEIARLKELTEQARLELEKVKEQLDKAASGEGLVGELRYEMLDQPMDVSFQGDFLKVLDSRIPADMELINGLADLNVELCWLVHEALCWKTGLVPSAFESGSSGLTIDDLVKAIAEGINFIEGSDVSSVQGQLRGQRTFIEKVRLVTSTSKDYEFEIVKDVTSIDQPKLLSAKAVKKE